MGHFKVTCTAQVLHEICWSFAVTSAQVESQSPIEESDLEQALPGLVEQNEGLSQRYGNKGDLPVHLKHNVICMMHK